MTLEFLKIDNFKTGICPIDYKLYDDVNNLNNSRCYTLHNEEKDFYDAETECNKLSGGHLASFHTEDQKILLLSMTECVLFPALHEFPRIPLNP